MCTGRATPNDPAVEIHALNVKVELLLYRYDYRFALAGLSSRIWSPAHRDSRNDLRSDEVDILESLRAWHEDGHVVSRTAQAVLVSLHEYQRSKRQAPTYRTKIRR